MTLDRRTAQALADANLMPQSEYIATFGSPDEKLAGMTDAIRVEGVRPEGFPRRGARKNDLSSMHAMLCSTSTL